MANLTEEHKWPQMSVVAFPPRERRKGHRKKHLHPATEAAAAKGGKMTAKGNFFTHKKVRISVVGDWRS